MSLCKLFHVSGHVQGVWYRASTKQVATGLGVKGHARNLPDGRVEVIACGDENQLERLEDWLWQGPDHAHVKSVDVCSTNPHPCEDFKTL